MSGLSRRAVAGLVTAACVVVAALAVTGTVLADSSDEVASIDGHTVSRDELLFHMRRLAPTVQNELRAADGAHGAVEWTASIGGKTALERLASRALDEIRRDKATLILAEQQGIDVAIDHEDFLTELAEENQRRADAIERGDVVYGTTEFSAEEYYAHRLTEVTTALQERLSADADDPLRVTDAEVRRAFDADRDAWSANATTYRYTKLNVRVPDSASVEDAADRLQRQVRTADHLADVAERNGDAVLTTDTYDGGSAGANRHDQQLLTVLEDLAPGEVSALITGAGHITYYELTDVTVDEQAALAGYSDRIRQSLVEEKFRQLLQRRVDASDTDIDPAAVDEINAEDVS